MKKIASTALIGFCGLLSQNIVAEEYDEKIFSCLTSSAKHILVEKQGNYYRYSYGKFNKNPEIVIKSKIAEVLTHPETGFYMAANTTTYGHMVFKNGNYEYQIYTVGELSPSTLSTIMEEPTAYASRVSVYKNGKQIADILCEKVLVDNLQYELPKTY